MLTSDAHVGQDNLFAELVQSFRCCEHFAAVAHLDDDGKESQRTGDELRVSCAEHNEIQDSQHHRGC